MYQCTYVNSKLANLAFIIQTVLRVFNLANFILKLPYGSLIWWAALLNLGLLIMDPYVREQQTSDKAYALLCAFMSSYEVNLQNKEWKME